MEKWRFNLLLFSRLQKVLDISANELARRCGMDQPVLRRYMRGENVLPIKTFLKICNHLRMPAHYFVAEGGRFEIPTRETAIIPLNEWQPVEWDTQAVELTFGDGEGRIYWKDVAEVMDLTSQKPHDQFLLRTRLKFDDFLTVCNHYGISPFKFIIDRNNDNAGQETPDAVAQLARKVRDLTATVADLTEKYKDLMVRYGKLEQALMETTTTGMAAEPEPLNP